MVCKQNIWILAPPSFEQLLLCAIRHWFQWPDRKHLTHNHLWGGHRSDLHLNPHIHIYTLKTHKYHTLNKKKTHWLWYWFMCCFYFLSDIANSFRTRSSSDQSIRDCQVGGTDRPLFFFCVHLFIQKRFCWSDTHLQGRTFV